MNLKQREMPFWNMGEWGTDTVVYHKQKFYSIPVYYCSLFPVIISKEMLSMKTCRRDETRIMCFSENNEERKLYSGGSLLRV